MVAFATPPCDGLHRRIRKTVGQDARDYYYNSDYQVLAEYKNDDLLNEFIWHPYYVDVLAARRAGLPSGGTSSKRRAGC